MALTGLGDEDETAKEILRLIVQLPEDKFHELLSILHEVVKTEKKELEGAVYGLPWVIQLFPRQPSSHPRSAYSGTSGKSSHSNPERGLRVEAAWEDKGVLKTDLVVSVFDRNGRPVRGASLLLRPMGKVSDGIEQPTEADGQTKFKDLVSARPDQFSLEISIPKKGNELPAPPV